MMFQGLAELNQLLLFRQPAPQDAFALIHKTPSSIQHEAVQDFGGKGIHSPQGKPHKDNVDSWRGAASFQRVNHFMAKKKLIITIFYKCPIQMYKMSLIACTSVVKFHFATDEKEYLRCFLMAGHSCFKSADE